MDRIRSAIVEGLILHPRVQQQSIASTEREKLAAAVPKLMPFRPQPLHEVVALLDWDHRLPSRKLTLHVHLFYDGAAFRRFQATLEGRLAEISQRNLYPEFDLPDLTELPADESYAIDLTLEWEAEVTRLVSPWRREVDSRIGHGAVDSVRRSKEFAEIRAATTVRAPHLGDLEAVGWIPPCESGQPGWAVDVWWLTSFDGRIGRGWSFLVEPRGCNLLVHREFTLRAS